jgi:hypothetical protein
MQSALSSFQSFRSNPNYGLGTSQWIAILFLACTAPIQAREPTYHVAHTQVLPGNVNWDYLAYEIERFREFDRNDQSAA